MSYEQTIRESVELSGVGLHSGAPVTMRLVPAPAGSRQITVLGAAARFFDPGDIIIIMNFAYLTPEELKTHKPKVVSCDENNHFKMMD